MKFSATTTCVFLTCLNAMQCTSQTAPNFTADADKIQNVMMRSELHGEQAIIDILVERSNAQRQEIAKEYKKLFNQDLLEKLRKYFVYDIKEAITALMIPKEHFYAYQLHHAMEGFGTNEGAISEILCSMSRDEILNVAAIYKQDYSVPLKDDLISDTSGSYMDLLVSLVNAERNESTEIDKVAVTLDAHALNNARKGHGENQNRPDESVYTSILTTRSRPQLKQTFLEYERISKKSIIQTIKDEFFGGLAYSYLILVKSVFLTRSQFYAIQLRESMLGLGTNDSQLIRIIMGRSEIDLKDIRKTYKELFDTDLVDSVADDTSGKYKDLLVSIIRK